MKKTLIGFVFLVIVEMASGLFSQHIMKTEIYLDVKEKVNELLGSDTKQIKHFSSKKKSYPKDESIKFTIKINQPSYLYLLSITDDKATITFPTKGRDTLFQKGKHDNVFEVKSSKSEPIEFELLSSKKPLIFPTFQREQDYLLSSRKEAIKLLESLESLNAEYLRTDVSPK